MTDKTALIAGITGQDGSGLAEFLLAKGYVVYGVKRRSSSFNNVGIDQDVTMRELALLIARVVGCEPRMSFDTSRSDGTPQKLLDTSRLRAMGWAPRVGLEDGLRRTYDWYLRNVAGR